MSRAVSIGLSIAVAPAILLAIAQISGSEDLVKVSEVALFNAALPLGAVLVLVGLVSVTVKRSGYYPFLVLLPGRATAALRDRLQRSPREWCIPFFLGISVPLLASGWLPRLLDFGTLYFGSPFSMGVAASAAAVCASIKNRLPPAVVVLLLFAGIPIGCGINEGYNANTFKIILPQVANWWALGLVPTTLGVSLGCALWKNPAGNI